MEFEKPVILSRNDILDVGNHTKWIPLSSDRCMLNPIANMATMPELQVYRLMQLAEAEQIPAHQLESNYPHRDLSQTPKEVWDSLAECDAGRFEHFARIAKLEDSERLFLQGAASAPTSDPQTLTMRLRSLNLALNGSHAQRQARLHRALQQSIPESTVDQLLTTFGATAIPGTMLLEDKHALLGSIFTGQEPANVHGRAVFPTSQAPFSTWALEKLQSVPFGQRVFAVHHGEGYVRPEAVKDPVCLNCATSEALCACSSAERYTEAPQSLLAIEGTKSTEGTEGIESASHSPSLVKNLVNSLERFRFAKYAQPEADKHLRKVLCDAGFEPYAVHKAPTALLKLALERFATRYVSSADVRDFGFSSVADWVGAWSA